MARTILQQFRQFGKEFNVLSDDAANTKIEAAQLFVSVPDTSDKSNTLIALFALHLCWMDKFQTGGGHRGTVASEQEGDSKRTYNAAKGAEDLLGQSAYGQQYKLLRFGLQANRSAGPITRYGDDV
jgi:hypothetical protein